MANANPPISLPRFRIVFHNEDGHVVHFTPLKNGAPGDFARYVVPKGLPHKIVDKDHLPDTLFLPAWEIDYTPGHPAPFSVNMTKAKDRVHNWRRQARDREMQPHDEIVAKAIPGQTQAAEAERAKLRKKYDDIQVAVDATTTPADLRAVHETHIKDVGRPAKIIKQPKA